MNQVINWHGLPCLFVEENGKKKAVIFTNIDNELTICTVDAEKLHDEESLKTMKAAHGFDCLGKTMPIQEEFTLVISLTEKCNAACRYCFLDAQTSGNVMSEQLLEDTIRYVATHYADRLINVAAFGGEPTVAPELLYKMVEISKANLKNYKFSITTNGYFDDTICSFLVENKFHVSLSMDGVPEVQRKQRPSKISIEQLEKNIKRLAASDCEMKVRATVTEFSCDYMLDTVKYLNSMGVNRIHFEPVTPGGRAAEKTVFTSQPKVSKFTNNLFECIEYGAKEDVDIICFPYMNMSSAPIVFCDGNIHNRLVVGASGVLSTCVEVQDKSHILYDSLGVGTYDHKKREFDFEFSKRRPFCRGCSDLIRDDNCSDCAFSFFCAGGCPTRNYRGSQNTETISNYRCQIMKEVMPFILKRYYESTF